MVNAVQNKLQKQNRKLSCDSTFQLHSYLLTLIAYKKKQSNFGEDIILKLLSRNAESSLSLRDLKLVQQSFYPITDSKGPETRSEKELSCTEITKPVRHCQPLWPTAMGRWSSPTTTTASSSGQNPNAPVGSPNKAST
ncbi:unnamed protein product [Malus baccata var. baccata]